MESYLGQHSIEVSQRFKLLEPIRLLPYADGSVYGLENGIQSLGSLQVCQSLLSVLLESHIHSATSSSLRPSSVFPEHKHSHGTYADFQIPRVMWELTEAHSGCSDLWILLINFLLFYWYDCLLAQPVGQFQASYDFGFF